MSGCTSGIGKKFQAKNARLNGMYGDIAMQTTLVKEALAKK